MTRRVLHVSAVDFTAARLLSPQMPALKRQGYDVRVACRRTSDAYWQEISDYSPFGDQFPRDLDLPRMLAATVQLGRIVRQWRPHIVHLHTPAASLAVRALPHPFWPRHTRLVYTVHGYLHQWPPIGVINRLVQVAEQVQSYRTDMTFFQSEEDLRESKARSYSGELVSLG